MCEPSQPTTVGHSTPRCALTPSGGTGASFSCARIVSSAPRDSTSLSPAYSRAAERAGDIRIRHVNRTPTRTHLVSVGPMDGGRCATWRTGPRRPLASDGGPRRSSVGRSVRARATARLGNRQLVAQSHTFNDGPTGACPQDVHIAGAPQSLQQVCASNTRMLRRRSPVRDAPFSATRVRVGGRKIVSSRAHSEDDRRVSEASESELPADDDVIIWHLQERDDLDVYRVTKGSTVLGEFTGRSIGSAVYQAAVEHAEPGRAVWLRDELGFRRLNPHRED
jgi:hypothetical protein